MGGSSNAAWMELRWLRARSVAMKLTGHKTKAVYRRYGIADSAGLAEGVEKLARMQAEGEPAAARILALRSAQG